MPIYFIFFILNTIMSHTVSVALYVNVLFPGLHIIYHKRLVINYGMGGYKTFCTHPPPSQYRVKHFASPFSRVETVCGPLPPSVWLKLQTTALKHLKTFFFCASCPHPSAWLKLVLPPIFVGVKLHLPPPPLPCCTPSRN